MTIHIPVWLLWVLGIVIGVSAVLLIAILAIFGGLAAHALKDGIWK